MDALARSRIYGFFSRLFIREVDDAFAAALTSPLGTALLPGWKGEDRTALDVDYAQLTVTNVMPYESFYLRPDGMVESGGANPLVVFLQKYGFEVDLAAARSIAPDHIGVELELMSVLCAREDEALREGKADYAARIRQVEGEFLAQHLLRFAPIYLLAVQRTARTALYRDAADATLHFLLQDQALLGAPS